MVRVYVRLEQDRTMTYVGNAARLGADVAVAPVAIVSQ
jgi:hypothetical protein